ncbi:MAG: GGDEF domain-containing protein [Sphingomonadaceae bacterium]
MISDDRVDVRLEQLTSENEALSAMLVELRARIAQLERLADTDPLLPLPNRRAFFRATRQAIADVEDCGQPAALLFVDLDGLKATNDKFGHEAGDAMLRHVAMLLNASLGEADMAARLGGDEFGILLRGCDELTAHARANALAASVSHSLLDLGVCAVAARISFGVAIVRGDDTPESVVARADSAMYAQRSDRKYRSVAVRSSASS